MKIKEDQEAINKTQDAKFGASMWNSKKILKSISNRLKQLKERREDYEEKVSLIKEIFIPLKEGQDKSNLQVSTKFIDGISKLKERK